MTTLREDLFDLLKDELREPDMNLHIDRILKLFEKLIDDTEEEIKKHITEDEDGLIDYGVSHLVNTLREKLSK